MSQAFVCPDFKDTDPAGKDKAFAQAAARIPIPRDDLKKPAQKKQRKNFVPRGGMKGRPGRRLW